MRLSHVGDVLLIGTPEGVGPIKPGDSIQSFISSIGTATTRVEATGAYA
jgi:2-keto-4-pentenoate hydratase/2-oxohepta-3-ene-1,7-dioic acid hydratase in catechol pathway